MEINRATKETVMEAMRAKSIPEGWSGRWFVQRQSIKELTYSSHNGRAVLVPPGTYTFLRVLTDSTLYNSPPGEVVMEDSPAELRTHLGFALSARGRVLVTGLGLGCVLRGLLANPDVEHVTVIERESAVLKLVAPYLPVDRFEIIQADARDWTKTNREPFDCAWHDLFTDTEKGEPHLDVWHAEIMANCAKTIPRQGAWAFDRAMKRLMQRHGLRWMG